MATSAIRLAAAGDTVAFARIVTAYHADMVRVAYVVAGGSQDLADDAVQAAWAIAWRRLRSLRDPERLKPWLVSVAANEARQLCRRQRRVAVVEIDVAMHDPAGSDPADRAGALVGSGDHKGYTYYFHARGTGTLDIESMIFLGSPPSP